MVVRSAGSDVIVSNQPILLVGGDRDPNVAALAATFERSRIAVRTLRFGSERPWILWDLERGDLVIDGDPIAPRAVFLRHDVFTELADPRPETSFRAFAWTTAVYGWLLAHRHVRCLNRASFASVPNKPHALCIARELGLAIPRTVVTNNADAARSLGESAIAKPVAGGDVTRHLADALSIARADGPVLAAPALVQELLHQPEVRLYVVGDETFAFEVKSAHLDYRVSTDVDLTFIGPGPEPIATQVRGVARRLGLDFAAADLKSRPDGSLVFLEINSAPMFARFDAVANGALTAALARWLTTDS